MEHKPTGSIPTPPHKVAPKPPNADAALRKLIHDLRGPLTSLQLGIETLLDLEPDQQTSQSLKVLLAEVTRMANRLEQASSERRKSCGSVVLKE